MPKSKSHLRLWRLGRIIDVLSMTKEIQCDVCTKPATVHLTQIISGKVHKVDLCEECAQKLGVTDPNGFSVSDLLMKDISGEVKAGNGKTQSCGTCGYTRMQFKKTGRLGCSDCYDAFSDVLDGMLKGMHLGDTHTGKVPHVSLDRRQRRESIRALETRLQEAVGREDFEAAAVLRDQIYELKAQTS